MSVVVGAFRGVLWSAAGTWIQVAAGLAGVAIIARWIGPEGYGLVGTALVLLSACRLLCAGALVESIVQRPDLEDGHVDATLLLQVTLAMVLAAVAWLLAPAACGLLGAPAAVPALRTLALLLPISALASVASALLQREMRFGELACVGTAATLASNLAGIAFAIGGAGPWSLVAMEVVRTLVVFAGVWSQTRWRPGLRGRWRHLRELGRFNANVLATYALGHADDLLPRALVAALLGPHALGQYLLARRVFEELSRIVTGPFAGVAMAAASRLQHDRPAAQRLVLGLYESAALLAMPCYLGLAVIAPLGIPYLFGNEWTAAVPAIQLLLLCGLRSASGVFNVSILRALGRPDLPLVLLGAGVALSAVLIPVLASWGVAGVMLAILLRTFGTWPLGCRFIASVTGIPVRRQLAAGAPALVAAVAMAALLWWLQTNGLAGLSPGGRLVTTVGIGALAYGLVLAAVSPRTLRRLFDLCRAVAGRDGRSLAMALGEPSR